MAGSSLTDLTALSSINDDDILYIVRTSTATPEDYKILISVLKSKILSESSSTVSTTSTLPVNVNNIILTVGASPINLILPDGINNQELLIVGNTLTSNAVITVTHFTNSTITFTLAGQSIKLKFLVDKWYVLHNNGTTLN